MCVQYSFYGVIRCRRTTFHYDIIFYVFLLCYNIITRRRASYFVYVLEEPPVCTTSKCCRNNYYRVFSLDSFNLSRRFVRQFWILISTQISYSWSIIIFVLLLIRSSDQLNTLYCIYLYKKNILSLSRSHTHSPDTNYILLYTIRIVCIKLTNLTNQS